MSASSETFLNVDVRDGVAALTLDRPPVNVLHIPMLRQLQDALAALAEDTEVRVLILGAAGKLFSAGVDVADHTPEKVGEMIPLFNEVCRALAEFPVPTIAAVQGHALGGGLELVLCCDLAVAAEGAQVAQPEIQLAALAPIAALRLPHVTTYRAAADLLFSGRRMTAAEALRLGLLNSVVPVEEVEGWAQRKAAELACLSRAALVYNKRALRMGFDGWAASLPDMERLYLDDLMHTADAEEGLAAFLEKRPPDWKHK